MSECERRRAVRPQLPRRRNLSGLRLPPLSQGPATRRRSHGVTMGSSQESTRKRRLRRNRGSRHPASTPGGVHRQDPARTQCGPRPRTGEHWLVQLRDREPRRHLPVRRTSQVPSCNRCVEDDRLSPDVTVQVVTRLCRTVQWRDRVGNAHRQLGPGAAVFRFSGLTYSDFRNFLH